MSYVKWAHFLCPRVKANLGKTFLKLAIGVGDFFRQTITDMPSKNFV
jgi:hypothetical protein